MTMKLLDLPHGIEHRHQQEVNDPFTWYVTAHQWTTVATDGGSVAVGDAAGGVVVLTPSDGSVADNDETYLKATNETLLFAANRSIIAESLQQYTEANTDDANVFFGFMNAIAANSIVDDGAGLKTNFSGCAIFKVDGGTVWKCISSLGTTQTISTSTKTAGGAAYQKLRIEWRAVSSTIGEAAFFVDDVPLIDSTTNRPIKHTFTYTSATEMQLGWGVKNGDTNLETLNVDDVSFAQSRLT